MSLINDALKRANQVPAPPPLPPTEVAKGLQPVPQPPSSGSTVPVIIFPILVFVVLALAAFFLVRGMGRNKEQTWGASLNRVNAREHKAVTPAAEPQTTANVPEKSPAALLNPPVTPSTPVESKPPVSPAPAPVLVTAPPPAPSFPALKVQGIFYRPKNPAAVINTKLVNIGDYIADAKVIAITRETVTVEWQGKQRQLSLY